MLFDFTHQILPWPESHLFLKQVESELLYLTVIKAVNCIIFFKLSVLFLSNDVEFRFSMTSQLGQCCQVLQVPHQ